MSINVIGGPLNPYESGSNVYNFLVLWSTDPRLRTYALEGVFSNDLGAKGFCDENTNDFVKKSVKGEGKNGSKLLARRDE